MYERLGSALYNGRRYQEALPYFLRALELDPNSSGARFSMALNYEKLGRFADAVAVLDRPEFRSSSILAREYALMGRRAEVLKILDSLTKPDPRH
jgi:tetratricopeptide (TPR) repeat protein